MFTSQFFLSYRGKQKLDRYPWALCPKPRLHFPRYKIPNPPDFIYSTNPGSKTNIDRPNTIYWFTSSPLAIGCSTATHNYSKTKTNWQLRAELKPSSTMPNFHISAVFFVMDSIILHIILKVKKLNLFHRIFY